MAIKIQILCYLGTFFFATVCHAIWFTDSKENDFPRIGKRYRALSTTNGYKNWLERNAVPTTPINAESQLRSKYNALNLLSRIENKNHRTATKQAIDVFDEIPPATQARYHDDMLPLFWSYLEMNKDELDL